MQCRINWTKLTLNDAQKLLVRLEVLNFGILLPDNNLILRKIGSRKMKQQDTTKEHKCIKITYFWHKIHVVQYICTNALQKLPDSALDVTFKMETAGTPGCSYQCTILQSITSQIFGSVRI